MIICIISVCKMEICCVPVNLSLTDASKHSQCFKYDLCMNLDRIALLYF